MERTRDSSLNVIADGLERMLHAPPDEPDAIYRSLLDSSELLHEDATDVLANVSPFVSDHDIRDRDQDYRAMQERTMRDLIGALRQGAARERLLTFSFLE